jgi:UDP-N-acetylglucosamine--N-acetylmuramyl-(pentapeptide) pyrophosphoryl-undecaprenol N-acetylglucosamine transferase
MSKIKCVLIAAGGTGGHVFPGIAVAKALVEQGIKVVWLGTQKGLDAKLVPPTGIPFYPIAIQGLRGKGKLSLALAPLKLLKGLYYSIKIIRQTKADLILGMGGYVSGPAGMAAFCLGKPLYIHEQNALAGWTNRFLSYFAKGVLTAFPHVFKNTSKVILVGNPVRADLLALPAPSLRLKDRQNPLRLLVVGGSQGAGFLNRLILSVAPQLNASEIEIYHQTGSKEFEAVAAQYQALNLKHIIVKPFIDDMAASYAWADLIICRAGALTISEVAAVGIASILVPFPYAVDDHQTDNAHYLSDAKAAILLQEKELSAEKLLGLLKAFIQDRTSLLTMSLAAHQLAKRDAAELVVKAILS